VALPIFGGVLLLVVAVVLALRAAPAPGTASPSASAAEPERFPNEWALPPPADVAALLDGLGPGSVLEGGWRVRGVSPVVDRKIVVDVQREDIGFRVWICLHDRDSRLPPRRTGRFSIYTAQPRPTQDAVRDEDFAQVLDAIAARVRSAEARVSLPRGM